jgi:predicted GNAT superfamily acetyltransferase
MTVGDSPAVLAINAQGTPHVAQLDASELARLLGLTGLAYVAQTKGGVAGYLIAFERESRYDGEEFLHLRQAIPGGFVYVDQVAVAAGGLRRGTGRMLYEQVMAVATARGHGVVCCEVNEHPPNARSMAFHRALGFGKSGSLDTRDGRRVALLVRR